MEQVQVGSQIISGGTGVSIQVIIAVVGGAVSFGVGALIWFDKRINSAFNHLADKIEKMDDSHRSDRLSLEGRIVRLEAHSPEPARWPAAASSGH